MHLESKMQMNVFWAFATYLTFDVSYMPYLELLYVDYKIGARYKHRSISKPVLFVVLGYE